MKQKDITTGKRYTAKVSGKTVALRIREIYEVGGGLAKRRTHYRCLNEATGREVTVKSAQRFRAALGTPVNEIWG